MKKLNLKRILSSLISVLVIASIGSGFTSATFRTGTPMVKSLSTLIKNRRNERRIAVLEARREAIRNTINAMEEEKLTQPDADNSSSLIIYPNKIEDSNFLSIKNVISSFLKKYNIILDNSSLNNISRFLDKSRVTSSEINNYLNVNSYNELLFLPNNYNNYVNKFKSGEKVCLPEDSLLNKLLLITFVEKNNNSNQLKNDKNIEKTYNIINFFFNQLLGNFSNRSNM